MTSVVPLNIRRGAILVAATVFVWAASASSLSHEDTHFLHEAARADHAEIEGSQLALKRSRNADVKNLAQQILTEHEKSSEELASLSTSKGLKLPARSSLVMATKLKTLRMSKGESFDLKFVKEVGVDAYAESERLFFKASTEATDADVRAFAARTLPIVEQRLAAAQKLLLVLDKD